MHKSRPFAREFIVKTSFCAGYIPSNFCVFKLVKLRNFLATESTAGTASRVTAVCDTLLVIGQMTLIFAECPRIYFSRTRNGRFVNNVKLFRIS